MNQRYYFSIRYNHQHMDVFLLSGRCAKALHNFEFKKRKHNIGIALPCWSDNNVGDMIAFVSEDKHQLLKFQQDSYFQMMASDEIFIISDITAVNSELPEVQFCRNNTISKMFIKDTQKRLRRTQKRAEARGDEFKPGLHENSKKRVFENFHSLPIDSYGTEDDFMLHIQKHNDVALSDCYTSYGFATNKSNQGTVPDMSILFNQNNL